VDHVIMRMLSFTLLLFLLIFQSIRAEFKAVSASTELGQWWPYSVTIFQSPSENN